MNPISIVRSNRLQNSGQSVCNTHLRWGHLPLKRLVEISEKGAPVGSSVLTGKNADEKKDDVFGG